MPEEEKEQKEVESARPKEDPPKSEEKRRIRPVIEEVVTEAPENTETAKEVTDRQKAEEPQIDEKRKGEIREAPAYEKATAPDESDSKSDIKLFIVVAVITAVIVAALAGGIYVYITGTRSLSSPTPIPAATIPPVSSPEATPTSSPSANLKLTDYKVQVLNGSGKIGEANKAKALLVKAGFKVSDTGNAATFDFTDTIIQVSNSVPSEVLDNLKSALSSAYSVKIGDNLDSTSDFDIIVTVGSKQ